MTIQINLPHLNSTVTNCNCGKVTSVSVGLVIKLAINIVFTTKPFETYPSSESYTFVSAEVTENFYVTTCKLT